MADRMVRDAKDIAAAAVFVCAAACVAVGMCIFLMHGVLAAALRFLAARLWLAMVFLVTVPAAVWFVFFFGRKQCHFGFPPCISAAVPFHIIGKGTETLRRGWTTGSCAAAASQAAAILLLTGSAPAEIRLLTPGGVTFNLPVEQASLHDGEAVCAVRKDAGDDPHITNGVLISSAVRRADSGIVIDGGSGVGRVTRPGLAEPVGEAAINPGPRAQIKAALEHAAQENGYEGGFSAPAHHGQASLL